MRSMFMIPKRRKRIGERTWPMAIPRKFATRASPEAVARSFIGNHLAATVLIEFIKKGCDTARAIVVIKTIV